MVKTMGRPNEIVLATQKGVFFANLGKGAHGLRQAQVQQLDKTAHFMYGRSSNSLDPNNAGVSVFAQDPSKGALSNVNDTSTSELNRPVANVFAPTQSSGADLNLQFQSLNQSNSIVNSKENPMLQVQTKDDIGAPEVTMTSIAISETKHGNPQKQEESKKGDQDDVLPAKRKRSTNERAGASNGFNSSSKENTTSQGEPSITASLQRKAKRTAVVKNPKKGIASSREQSPGSDQGGISQSTTPFGKKASAATHQPNQARENYVNQDDISQGVMSTQNQAVVGDHSSIYLNTEEA